MMKLMTISALSASLLIAAPTTGTAKPVSARTAESTLAKVREHVAVFRKAKTKRDVLAHLHSRLVYDKGAQSRIYLAVRKNKLCLYDVSKAHGSAGSSCQPASDVLSGRSVLLLMSIGPRSARFAAVAPDGSSRAQERASGSIKQLRIRHNMIIDEVTGPPVTVSWISPAGKRIAYPYLGPGTI